MTTDTDDRWREGCQTCAADPTRPLKRYCAPLRCYCGHPACPAFASWEPLQDTATPVVSKPKSTAWTDREGATWIDNL